VLDQPRTLHAREVDAVPHFDVDFFALAGCGLLRSVVQVLTTARTRRSFVFFGAVGVELFANVESSGDAGQPYRTG
jgi:hypothetical protein